MVNIILNGTATKVENPDLGSLVHSRFGNAKNLILEWNGRILTEQDQLKNCELQDGDVIDLFSMVGGG